LAACHCLCAGLDNVTVVWARAEEGGRKPELRDVSSRHLFMQLQSGVVYPASNSVAVSD
jgi:hypothetical protein